MFHMMNEARLGVGMGAVSLGYTGYLKSLEYARERPQGRPVTAKDPSTPQVPIIEHADVKRMLLAQKAYVEGATGAGAVLRAARSTSSTAPSPTRSASRPTLLLDILTPVAKSWPSQWCLEANNLAIQVHGGYGYTREYDVEQHYRDNRLNPIHEGTHGIQSLDLLGRKVTQRGGASLAELGKRDRPERSPQATASGGEAAELARAARRSLAAAGRGHRRRCSAPVTSRPRLANSAIYLEAFGHIVIAWMWLEQFVAARRAGRGLLRRQAAGGAVLLPLRTAEDGAATGPAGMAGPHHAGDARRLVRMTASGHKGAQKNFFRCSTRSKYRWQKFLCSAKGQDGAVSTGPDDGDDDAR